MSLEEFNAALRPKVQGSWNLHHNLPKGLDFFVLLSSLAGVVGSRGQANYACGNVYQDNLARYRVSDGQKAVSIDVGLMESIGYAAERKRVMDHLLSQGFATLTEQELLDILAYYCDPKLPLQSPNQSQIITGLETPASLKARGQQQPYWLDRPLFNHLHQMGNSTVTLAQAKASNAKTDYTSLLSTIESLDAAKDIICKGIIGRLSEYLAVPKADISANKPAFSYGVDSLSAVEIRQWLLREIGAEISVFRILGNQSLVDLALFVAKNSRLVPVALRAEHSIV